MLKEDEPARNGNPEDLGEAWEKHAQVMEHIEKVMEEIHPANNHGFLERDTNMTRIRWKKVRFVYSKDEIRVEGSENHGNSFFPSCIDIVAVERRFS